MSHYQGRSVVDGLTPGQRKVIYTCLKRNLVKELKVTQLAGSVVEMSAYYHGEKSLMATIINLAQNFVGSNNINLLQPIGQFGSRLNGGKDAASPRYIFTMLSTLARHIFNPHDDSLLHHLRDNNRKIEPEYYVPLLPMVLINGADGIGTGWSTKFPNYDIREIVNNLQLMIEGRDPLPMLPSFKNFQGTIEQIDESRWVTSGEVSVIDNQTIEITELPIRVWTQNYKESVLEPMFHGTDKTPSMIQDYMECNTDTTVKFIVKITPEALSKAEASGLHTVFKLQTLLSSDPMELSDAAGCIKRYTNVEEILREFYVLRMEFYHKRKSYLEGMLAAESLKLNNQAKFISEIIDKVILLESKPKKELVKFLVRRGYNSDPVKAWKESQDTLEVVDSKEDSEARRSQTEEDTKDPDFNYLLDMEIWSLSLECYEDLMTQRDVKCKELLRVRQMTADDLWKEDLTKFLADFDKFERKEIADDAVGSTESKSKLSLHGRRIVPSVDAIRFKVEALKALKMKGDKKAVRSDDEDLDAIADVPLRARIGRSKAPVKYNLGESDEDEDV